MKPSSLFFFFDDIFVSDAAIICRIERKEEAEGGVENSGGQLRSPPAGLHSHYILFRALAGS
jgi:hypothetical protein